MNCLIAWENTRRLLRNLNKVQNMKIRLGVIQKLLLVQDALIEELPIGFVQVRLKELNSSKVLFLIRMWSKAHLVIVISYQP